MTDVLGTTWDDYETVFVGSDQRVGGPFEFDFPENPIDNPKAKTMSVQYVFENGMTRQEAQDSLADLIAELTRANQRYPSRWVFEGGDNISSGNALRILSQIQF